MQAPEIPVIEVSHFLENNEQAEAECRKVVFSLHRFGVLILKDPRVSSEHNGAFIDLMEKYFSQQGDKLYAGETLDDEKKDIHHQRGITPPSTEKAIDHCARFAHYDEENKPLSECPPKYDAKWRFFWRIGEDLKLPQDAHYNQVKPDGFEEWEDRMNKWGGLMLDGCWVAAQMAARGFGLPVDTFTSLLEGGNHLLAPTASDLNKYQKGTIFAGVHTDLNFLTIHGKSRFPGLYIWLRDGRKIPVKVPDGCLLLQAGLEFEHLTAGYIKAGFHEVIYGEGTKQAVEKAKEEINEGKQRILWRISSTLFSHIRSNVVMEPLEGLTYLDGKVSEKEHPDYPPIKAIEHVVNTLKQIEL